MHTKDKNIPKSKHNHIHTNAIQLKSVHTWNSLALFAVVLFYLLNIICNCFVLSCIAYNIELLTGAKILARTNPTANNPWNKLNELDVCFITVNQDVKQFPGQTSNF